MLRAVLSPAEEESVSPLPGGVTGPPACPISPCTNSPTAPHVCVQVAGMLRVVLSPIEEELPFVTGVTLSLLERPYLDFDVR